MAGTAVVIFNLGGPDGLETVKPFLFNLFNDPTILRMPAPARWLVAKLISWRRAPVARVIYGRMGGRSPILEKTRNQAEALQRAIDEPGLKVFVAMRHWHPFAEECAAEITKSAPDRIILLPMYPQFSTTTTGSFLQAWSRAAVTTGLDAPTTAICCYPTEPGFIEAVTEMIRPAYRAAARHGTPRVLFSAHGLPRKFVENGDGYQHQVEQTVAAMVAALAMDELDHTICYQSRVGRMEWLRPYTDHEIARAGADGVPLVVVPVAFVSEHSETLVELDMEYAELARAAGVPAYERVAAAGTETAFIAGLARLVRRALDGPTGTVSASGGRICPAGFGACIHAPGDRGG